MGSPDLAHMFREMRRSRTKYRILPAPCLSHISRQMPGNSEIPKLGSQRESIGAVRQPCQETPHNPLIFHPLQGNSFSKTQSNVKKWLSWPNKSNHCWLRSIRQQ